MKVLIEAVEGKSFVEALVGSGLLTTSTPPLSGNFDISMANNLNGWDVSGVGMSRICTKEGGCCFSAIWNFCSLKNLMRSLKGEIERSVGRLE